MSIEIKDSLVIIPCYNEALNVGRMIEELFTLYPEINLLFIDDNSPDKTADIIRIQQANYDNLHLIERSHKMGLGSAYVIGFQWALEKDFQTIVEMDCDFSHSPKDVIRLINASASADLVIGSRYQEGGKTENWPWYRLVISKVGSFFTRLLTGMTLLDMTGGFKCFRRSTLEQIDLLKIMAKGYVFQCEMNFKVQEKGLIIKEIPITFHQRTHGVSKMSLSIAIEGLIVILKLRFKKILGT